jgi:hypothetical protein
MSNANRSPIGTPNDERFWNFVHKTETCWLWMGARANDGYGHFYLRKPDGTFKLVMAHVYAYEITIGPVPEGKLLDHLKCDNPPCVRPEHLSPATPRENVLRGNGIAATNASKTSCVNGHEFIEANTGRDPKGNRFCRTCAKITKNKGII